MKRMEKTKKKKAMRKRAEMIEARHHPVTARNSLLKTQIETKLLLHQSICVLIPIVMLQNV